MLDYIYLGWDTVLNYFRRGPGGGATPPAAPGAGYQVDPFTAPAGGSSVMNPLSPPFSPSEVLSPGSV